ncbi:caspase domain-containing protein [Crucibulum laeve]|uniref:Caspase domain-containing protein n=1 Tax=Crucibulum laeve TaxID=68775 RepID=A0A5C3M310_9AGAR|nr:caspase domain-containing protein [Crucibulum laeve]
MKVIRHRPQPRRPFVTPLRIPDEPTTPTLPKKRALLIGIQYDKEDVQPKEEDKKKRRKKKKKIASRGLKNGENKENVEAVDGSTELSDDETSGSEDEDATVGESSAQEPFLEPGKNEFGAENGKQRGGEGSLKGPHRDVHTMKELLIDHYGYKEEDIMTLVDVDEPGQVQPTRENIILHIQKLIEGARAGDRFFFHYAGHSFQMESDNPAEEEDGQDEYLSTVDGLHIKDDELRQLLVDCLPVGSTLCAVFDSCHSASLLDLDHFRCNRVFVPWISKGQRRTKTKWLQTSRKPAADVSLSVRRVYQTKRFSPVSVSWRQTSIDQMLNSPSDYRRMSISSRSKKKSLSVITNVDDCGLSNAMSFSPTRQCDSPVAMFCTGWCDHSPVGFGGQADVIALSASKDDQQSWEDINGDSMTQALIRVLKKDPHPSLRDMLTSVSHDLHRFYLKMHGEARSLRKKAREKGRTADHAPEMNNFQDPQISSQLPLDRNRRWDP